MISRLHRKFIPWLIAHSFEYWYYYSGALLCLYFLHYSQSVIPSMAKDLGDKALDGNLGDIKIYEFLLLALAILLFRTFSRLLFFYPARIQQRNLRVELMQRLERAVPKTYQDFSEGEVFQTVVNDLNRIRGFVGFALLQVGNIIIAAIIFIPRIQEFNPSFLLAFTPLLMAVLLFSLLVFFFQPFVRKNMDAYAQVQNFLIESYAAKKTVKNFHAESSFFDLFRKYSGLELHYFFISGVGRVFSFPMVKLGVGASLIWGAIIVRDQSLPGTDLIFFSGFLYLILEPLMFLSWIGIVTGQGYAAWSRIKKLVTALNQSVVEGWYQKNINLKNIGLPFWGKTINFEFRTGQWNVIVGDTGAGKSWLMEKISEQLVYNKVPYSYIKQEPYLYNDTVQDNIFLGSKITSERLLLVKRYLVEFGLDILADTVDEVLQLEVGEHGKKVSGGQAKRIALLRSLVADVDIILWDDPFSSVDLILERQIIQKMKRDEKLKEKTFILSSHRISTVRASDWVVFVEKDIGILESGEQLKVLEEGKLVSEYFKKQMV